MVIFIKHLSRFAWLLFSNAWLLPIMKIKKPMKGSATWKDYWNASR